MQNKKPSMGVVWIFSGTAHFLNKLQLIDLATVFKNTPEKQFLTNSWKKYMLCSHPLLHCWLDSGKDSSNEHCYHCLQIGSLFCRRIK